ncbi:MAG: hypothetical protein ACFFG0_44800, partial [Candidatus Thorarchaeota archaeon]
ISIFFNSIPDLINWTKLYGIFLLLVYFQLFMGLSEARYINYGFFPIIFLGVSGLSNIYDLIKDYTFYHKFQY